MKNITIKECQGCHKDLPVKDFNVKMIEFGEKVLTSRCIKCIQKKYEKNTAIKTNLQPAS